MLRAVHEHRVELPVADPAGPVAYVLTRLAAEAAREVDVRSIGMRDVALARHACGIAPRHVVETPVPGQGPEAVGRAILVDQRLLRRPDDDWRRGRPGGRRRPRGRRRCRGWRRGRRGGARIWLW